jgi:transposase
VEKIKKRKQLSEIEKRALEEFIDEAETKKETCRAQAILLLDEGNESKVIERFTRLKSGYVYELTQKFKNEGIASLKNKRNKKPKTLLTKGQREAIRNLLKDETPHNYGYDCDQWSTSILAELIEKRFNVRYKSKTSYYIIFKDARFSFRKPDTKYHQHDDAAVARWKTEHKPIIEAALYDENTVVLCADEMVLSSATTIQKVWLSIDNAPKIEVTGTRKNRSIYGFLDIRTGHEYAFKTPWQNMYQTVDVLKLLRKQLPHQTLFICWDNAGWHRGSKVLEFIAADDNIKIIHFPSYSPELNPQEHVWKAGRSHVTHNKLITNIDQTTDKFVCYLNTNTFNYSIF